MNWRFWRKPTPEPPYVPPPKPTLDQDRYWFRNGKMEQRLWDVSNAVSRLNKAERDALPWVEFYNKATRMGRFRAGHSLIEMHWVRPYPEIKVTVDGRTIKADVSCVAGPWAVEVDHYLTAWAKEMDAADEARREVLRQVRQVELDERKAELEKARRLYVD